MGMIYHKKRQWTKLKEKGEKVLASSDSNIEFEEKGEKYTKTEINRMPLSELQEVAFRYGIENATDMTSGEIKRTLIEKLGL